MPKTHWLFTEKDLVKMLQGEVVESKGTSFSMESGNEVKVEIDANISLDGKLFSKTLNALEVRNKRIR